MANNSKVDQDERDREIKKRKELEKLIQQTGDELKVDVDRASKTLKRHDPGFLNYHDVKEIVDNEATEIVLSIAEFYLNPEIIEKVNYVKQKTKVDKITVSSLLFQMKTAEHAIIKLLGEIDDGNLHPRTFEVLASLQRSKMEIVKHMAQFMLVMENAYKSFHEDYRIKKSENRIDDSEEIEEVERFKTRGSKALIKALTELKDDEMSEMEAMNKMGEMGDEDK